MMGKCDLKVMYKKLKLPGKKTKLNKKKPLKRAFGLCEVIGTIHMFSVNRFAINLGLN
jgi:hypothetical protein